MISIKPQDIVVLAKLISRRGDESWTQHGIAAELCLSPSQVNYALKRLLTAGLMCPTLPPGKPIPIIHACEEFFLHGFKYVFPAQLGASTRGVPTSYAAPSFNGEIVIGNDPIPVWPYAEGTERGAAVQPLHSSVPKSISKYPDPVFYAILSLLDAIRIGRARERAIGKQKLSELLKIK